MKISLIALIAVAGILSGSAYAADDPAQPLEYRNVIGIYVTGVDGVPVPVLNAAGNPTGQVEGTTFISPLSSMPVAWASADASVAAVAVPWAKAWAGVAEDDPVAAIVRAVIDAP